MILTEIAPMEDILGAHRVGIGNDFTAYRNHVYRVANLCGAMTEGSKDPNRIEKIGIAAAFHDLGIWTENTFDYLPPSIRLAREHLVSTVRSHWVAEITEMIEKHHKVTAYGGTLPLVEPFRRADWIDITMGLIRFGQPRAFIRELYEEWPGAGFHRNLLRLEARHLCNHPLNPLPMFRW
jgi:hypothetical protein